MSEPRIDEMERQIDALQRQQLLILWRLARLEGARTTLEPPPVVAAPVVAAPVPKAHAAAVSPPPPAAAPVAPVWTPAPAPSSSAGRTEYQIGAQFLPRLGAAMVVIAAILFVSWGVRTGWITPTVQFVAELTLCAVFIGLGLWKREEREEFGQILTGIGSVGLYLSLAGAYVFKDRLVSSEALVAGFLAVSAGNLAFGTWRASQAFVALGAVGGLAASLMPLDRNDYALQTWLHFLVVAPTLLIAVRHRWVGMVQAVAALSFVSLLPNLTQDPAGQAPWSAVAAWHANLVLGAVAIAAAGMKNRLDSFGISIPILTTLGGIAALLATGLAHPGPMDGALHLVPFGLALVASALAFRETERARFAASSAIVLFVLAPLGLHGWASFWALATLAGLLGAVALAPRSALPRGVALGTAVIGAVDLGLALIAYLSHVAGISVSTMELGALALLIAATVLVACGALRVEAPVGFVLPITFAFLMPFASRGGYLLVPEAMGPWLGSAIALGLLGSVCAAFAIAQRSIAPRSIAQSSIAAAALGAAFLFVGSMFWVGAASSVSAPALELSMLALFSMVAFGLGAGLTLAVPGGERQVWALFAFSAVGVFATRAAVLLVGLSGANLAPVEATVLGLAGVGLLGGALLAAGAWPTLPSLRVGAALFAAAALAWEATVALSEGIVWQTGAWLAVLNLAAVASAAWAGLRCLDGPQAKEHRDLVYVFAAAAAWLGVSRLGINLFQGSFDMPVQPSVSLSWSLFGFAAVLYGFAASAKTVRYVGLAALLATAAKVLMVDLSGQSFGLRVAAFLVLGLAMLAAGYLYIRRENLLKGDGPSHA